LNECCICGSNFRTQKYQDKIYCNKHYLDMKRFGEIRPFSNIRHFTQDEIEKIETEYLVKTSKQLAEELNCKTQKIQDVVRRLKLSWSKVEKNRKYNADFDYFEVIDNQEKAYWLGFIYADGCVSKRETTQGVLTISINTKDEILLNLFKNDIKAENPIGYDLSKSSMARISIISDKLFSDLGKLNCVPNKTFLLDSIPQGVPQELYSHFIRGYFDGDGCVRLNGYKNAEFSIVGQEKFILFIRDIIKQQTGIELGLYYDKRTNNFCFISTANQQYIAKIYKYLYNDAIRYLPRKKIVFEEFLKSILNHYGFGDVITFNKIYKEEIV